MVRVSFFLGHLWIKFMISQGEKKLKLEIWEWNFNFQKLLQIFEASQASRDEEFHWSVDCITKIISNSEDS